MLFSKPKKDEKITLRMGKNIFKWSNRKGISKIYKQLMKLNIRKIQIQSKSRQKIQRDISPKTYR